MTLRSEHASVDEPVRARLTQAPRLHLEGTRRADLLPHPHRAQSEQHGHTNSSRNTQKSEAWFLEPQENGFPETRLWNGLSLVTFGQAGWQEGHSSVIFW